jgi:hypothetical protein
LVQIIIEARGDTGIRAFELFSGPPTAEHLRSFERSLESANWAAHLSRPWVQFAQFEWLSDGGEKAVVGRDGWFFYKPGLNDMLARPATEPPNGTNDPIAAIVHFRDQLAARGIQLVVMPVPNKDSVYPDRLTARAEPLHSLLAPRTREFLRKLRAAQVEVVDLFEEFERMRRQASDSQVPLYLAQDTHWTPAGVDLAAKAAARRLKELGWIGPGEVEYREQPAPVQRLGDIVRMLQVPLIERRVAPETVHCMQVVRRDNGELYKDGAEAQLLVIGDSFLRIYQHDEPRAAGFIAHLAKELRQPMMALVNDGGGSTLVRQELRARSVFLKNKKVVLWEFVERDLGLGTEGWKLVSLPPVAPAISAKQPSPRPSPIGWERVSAVAERR